jgi:hypothetical protein
MSSFHFGAQISIVGRKKLAVYFATRELARITDAPKSCNFHSGPPTHSRDIIFVGGPEVLR